MTVGILALQGDVREHAAALRDVGAGSRPVRRPADLDGVDGLVLPGGESTTLSLLLGSSGLFDAVAERLAGGLPVLGTCAGMILLATTVLDGRPDQRSFGAIDLTVRRNGYGRQLASFEGRIDGPAFGPEPLPAVFIRAPLVEAVGPDVEVLATLPPDARTGPGRAVVARQGPVMVAACHPELTGDRRVHRYFVEMLETAGVRTGPAPVAGAWD